MPRYWGEGPHEMYYQRNGKWYFPHSSRGYDTLEEAQEGYRNSHGRTKLDDSADGCLALIAMGVSLFLIYLILFY